MSCAYEEELTAYLDRELDEVTRKAIDAHLPGCVRCRASLALLEQAVQELGALPPLEPTPQLRREVLHRISERSGLFDRLRTWAVLPAVWVPAGVLAAGLVIAVGVTSRMDGAMDAEYEAQLELAANLEDIEDLDVVGLEDPEDLEIVLRLHELEGRP
jgi:anti-sigma factor RsiW